MTSLPRWRCLIACLIACVAAAWGAAASGAGADVTTSTLTVPLAGTGAGTITSDPAGLTCSATTCSGSFDPATIVVLTETPAAGNGFGGFTGACTATTTTTCTVPLITDAQVTATFDAPPTLSVTSPANATGYPEAAVPDGAFTCPGAGVTCSVAVDGAAPTPSGDPLPATQGSHTFTV